MRVPVPRAVRVATACLAALLGVWFSTARYAHAQDADVGALRVVVLGPLDPVVYQRIEGQLADLPWERVPVEAPSEVQTLGERFAIARAHDARAIVWIETVDDALVVHVADVAEQRLFTRALSLSSERRSVIYEEAAIVIRSTLVVLALGEEIGREVAAVEVEPPPVVPPSPEPVEVAPEPVAPEPVEVAPEPVVAPRVPVVLEAGVGVGLALDGIAEPLAVTPVVRFAASRHWLMVGLDVGYAPRIRHETGDVSLTLRRTTIVASAGYVHRTTTRIVLVPALRAGVLHQRRRTQTAATSPLVPTPTSATVSLVVGAELRAIVSPSATRHRLAFVFALGVDVLAPRPAFTVEDALANRRLDTTWPLVPRLEFVIVGRVGR